VTDTFHRSALEVTIRKCEGTQELGPAQPRREVLVPIFSVTSIGTRQPFKKMLRRLNQQIISTSLRVITSPWRLRRSWRVESVTVPELESSSVALHI
jgi:hypothetical protein